MAYRILILKEKPTIEFHFIIFRIPRNKAKPFHGLSVQRTAEIHNGKDEKYLGRTVKKINFNGSDVKEGFIQDAIS